MITFKQYLAESISRDELIKHYNEKHGGYYTSDAHTVDSDRMKVTREFRSAAKAFYTHHLDPKKLAKLPGRNNEHINHKTGNGLVAFNRVKDSIKKHGFQNTDPERGHTNGAMIRVLHHGRPVVHEGNKRTRASAELGHKTIPVNWAWENNSHHHRDAPHPVDYLHDDDIKKLHKEIKAKKNG